MTEEAAAKRNDAHMTIDINVSDRPLEGTCDPANCKELSRLLDEAYRLHAQDQKRGAIEALSATVRFLKLEGATEAQTLPLEWLLHDLASKRQGNEKPLFDAGRDGILVAAIDILMESGMTETQARKAVHEAIGKARDKAQLRNLRGHIREGRTNKNSSDQYHEAKAVYRALRENQFATVSEEFWREALLTMVAEQFGLKKT